MILLSFIFISALLFTVESQDCPPSLTTVSGHEAPNQICSGDLIFSEDFNSLSLKRWTHERNLAGGGNWEFQWYTNNRSNSYAEDGKLKIRPTYTSDHYGEDFLRSGTLDINGALPTDHCTNAAFYGCIRTGGGDNILNPIKSARLSSWESFSFKYGRVEVSAKLPEGDWLWPAIWLRPRYNAYGEITASGEIDIMESRGNRQLILNGVNIGVNQAGSTLHWGADFTSNQYPRTHWDYNSPVPLSDDFHVYGLSWTPDTIEFFVDGQSVGSVSPPAGGFWELGQIQGYENPWRGASKMAPFDDEYYILLNLAVGGIGYFPDEAVNPTGKPWSNNSPRAMADFWEARNVWEPTWGINEGKHIFQIDYIKVYAL